MKLEVVVNGSTIVSELRIIFILVDHTLVICRKTAVRPLTWGTVSSLSLLPQFFQFNIKIWPYISCPCSVLK